jgi:hypothetical protein
MILSTGKYLNVVRECGASIKSPFIEELEYTTRTRVYRFVAIYTRIYISIEVPL